MNHEPFIVDAHIHYGNCARFYMPDVSLERMIKIMDRCGIKRVVGSHIVGLCSHHFEYAHGETLKAVQKYPGRVFGYAIYDPVYPEESLESMKKHLSMDGFVGVKIHPAMHRYPLDGENYTPFFQYASENEIVVLTHTWDPMPQNTYPFDPASVNAQPKLVDSVAKRFPRVKIILAHSGGHHTGHVQAIEVARKHENVYVDICGDGVDYGVIEWFVKEVGAEKILYGSDLTWLDPRAHIGRVLGADISQENKECILFKNAESLFRFTSK